MEEGERGGEGGNNARRGVSTWPSHLPALVGMTNLEHHREEKKRGKKGREKLY